MAISGTIKMTAEQYLALGEDPPGVRLELVDGEVAVSPSPTPAHGYTLFSLLMVLGNYIEANDLGELNTDIDTVFEPHEVRRPDILFFAKSRRHLIAENKPFRVPPDLAVEVVRPSSVTMDRENKFNLYRRNGVPFYWIVDPAERTFDGFELVGRDYVSRGHARENQSIALPPFAEMSIPLAKLWRPGADSSDD